MDKKYCIFNDKVYIIEKIDENKISLKKDNMIIQTSLDKVQIMTDDYIPNNKKSTWSVNTIDKTISNEIMLRHMTKDEAINTLEKYIDQAIINKLGRVRIIHGRHGGVLRNAVFEYLSNHPFIQEFYLASYGEGDIGVTVAIIGKKST